MKKFLKIFVIVVLVIFIILFTAPFIFKGKIITIANEQMEKNLNAHASFSDINLSLIKNFPNLSVNIKNLNIIGKGPFEGDTLLGVRSFDLVVNVVSAIKMKNIKIKRIAIDHPLINAIVLKNGKANWDIVPESTSQTPQDTTSSTFNTKIALKLFSIDHAIVRYNDSSANMYASLNNLNFKLKGDLAQDYSKLLINSDVQKLSFAMDGVDYLKKALLRMHFDVDANLKDGIYVLKKNAVSLNALTLGFDGSIAMPKSGDIITKLKFATNKTDFKTLLSLIPTIYMTDFADMKASGNFKLDGKIYGSYTKKTTPSADIKLVVNNGTFSYPDLPKSAKDIAVDVDVHYDGAQMDNTTVDVNKFHLDLGGNPVDMVLNLKHPISDPFTSGKLAMSLDLASIKQIIPLKKTDLRGMIKANLDWMGKMSSIENEQYQDFKADGNIEVSNLYYNSPDVPRPFTLSKASMSFSPKFLSLSSFDAKLGKSDFNLQGKLSNYIPYILKNKTVKGELSLNSNLIDLNEFMTGSELETTTAPTDTTPLEVIPVPANIDFTMTSTIHSLKYDKMDISDLEGIISIKDQSVLMKKLSMNTLGGSMSLSGEYNTKNIKAPLVKKFTFEAKNIDIPTTVNTFATVGKLAPVAKKATGRVSVNMVFSTTLTQHMEPVMNSITSTGTLSSHQIGIKNATAFDKISEVLKTNAFKNLALNDVNIKFKIANGNISVDPFDTKMGDVNMTIGGQQSLANTLDYNVNLSAPRKLLGLQNPAINDLYASAASKGLNIPKSDKVNMAIKVTGKMTDPKVSIDLKKNLKKGAQAMKEQMKEDAKKAIEAKKAAAEKEAKMKAQAQADRIMKEAQKQAAAIRADAKKAADVVRKQTDESANKVLSEARNPIAKAAAKPAAEKIRREGYAKADKLQKDADAKANQVLKAAKTKSDQLLK